MSLDFRDMFGYGIPHMKTEVEKKIRKALADEINCF